VSAPARHVEPAPILFVHHAGIDWIRGSTRCLLDLLTHIDRARFAPIVWCNQPTIRDAVRALDIPVQDARYWGDFHPLRPDRRWIAEALALVERHRIRLMHADEFTQASVLVPVARRARIPLLAQLHQVPTPEERLWSLLHQVDLAVGTTRACITGLLADGFPQDRATVIYNGIDPDRLSAGDATTLRASLGIPSHAVVFTLVGSLIHRKAIDIALRALAHLQSGTAEPSTASAPPVHLVLCGSGPEREALGVLAASLGVDAQTTFLGECAHAGAIMRDATDVLVAPSRDESFGLTLAEAGLFGVPAVASNIPAHVEVVGEESGLLVPVEDPVALADAMERMRGDSTLRRRMGDAARQRTTSMFLIDRYVREFEDTYASLLSRPASAWGWRRLRWPHAYNRWIGDAVRRRLPQAHP
jgi:glycosyltransferase involved in cell wall biosynthesis